MAENKITCHGSKFQDLSGHIYGKLTVLSLDREKSANHAKKKSHWTCQCSCGNIVVVLAQSLRGGLTKSCGCLSKELTTGYKHGHAGRSGTSLSYTSWQCMKGRCLNKVHLAYSDYGGRGICVCEFFMSFENFVAKVGERPSRQHSIGREDSNKHYSCGGCDECLRNGWTLNARWETRRQQSLNTRRSRRVSYLGETKTISEWAETTGVCQQVIKSRLNLGWTMEEALTIPVGKVGTNRITSGRRKKIHTELKT